MACKRPKRKIQYKIPKNQNINVTFDSGKTTYRGSVTKKGNNVNVRVKRKKKSFLDDLF